MKIFLNNIYIFSKLSIVLTLAGLLVFTGYLFFRSYVVQSNQADLNTKEKNIFLNLINNNEDKIEKLNIVIKNLDKSLDKINTNFQAKQDGSNEVRKDLKIIFEDIKNEINYLNERIEGIQKITEINKNSKRELTPEINKQNNIIEVFNLIKLKFESGKNFSLELDTLSHIGDLTITPTLEKMYILNNSNFKGNEYLLMKFRNETNKYLSHTISRKNKLIKPLLPYIKVQPTNTKNLNTKILIDLKKIEEFIIKKDYEKSFEVLKTINNYNEYFDETFEQLKIGKSFYIALKAKISND